MEDLISIGTIGLIKEKAAQLISQAKRSVGDIHILDEAKRDLQRLLRSSFVRKLLPGGVAFMGNGVNDELMFRHADLAIAIVGKEGCATATLMASHIVVKTDWTFY